MKSEEFKAAVGKFPTGVTVISTSYKDKLYAFTANSFTSVSLKPSLISFCLDKNANSFDIFYQCSYFAVSILSSDQAYLAGHFASHSLKNRNKFCFVKYTLGKYSKAPLINGAISIIECKKYNQFECGDHFIFIGQVKKIDIDKTKSPLLYFCKTYLEL